MPADRLPLPRVSFPRFPVALALALALVALLAPSPARSQCANWIAGPLAPNPIGADGEVRAMTVWNNGTQNVLVIGGDFKNVNGVPASYVAAWDGLQWHALGNGVDGPVYALTVWNGALVAGGCTDNATIGGTFPMVEMNTGGGWFYATGSLGISPDTVFALAAYGGNLIAGGRFNDPSQLPNYQYHNIASYGGAPAGWSKMKNGTSGSVYSLCVTNLGLFVGGAFSYADTVGVIPNIALWNGSNWARVHDGSANGPSQAVMALTAYGGNLVVGLHYPAPSGVIQWNGSNWIPGGTLCSGVYALTVLNNTMYAGGTFSQPHGCAISRVAQWNGSDWVAVGAGIDPTTTGLTGPPIVDALQAYNGALFASGAFTLAGSTVANGVGSWSGGNWSAPDAPLDVQSLAPYGAKMAIGGYFEMTLGSALAYSLLWWDGTQLGTMGSGLDGAAFALKGYTTGSGVRLSNNLVVAGSFTHAGGVAAPHVALWSEASIYPFNSWSALGSGFDNSVYALEFLNGSLVAGGAFLSSGTTATSNIGRWNGTSWQPMGSGMNAAVHALKSYSAGFTEGALVAGGDFTTAGGVSANHVAIWTKSTLTVQDGPWTAVGTGVNGSVYAIERYNGRVVVAGAFGADGSGVTALNNVAAWSGSAWVPLGVTPGGGVNGAVRSLRVEGGYLYAAGDFTTADGAAALHAARWNGTAWSAVDVGTDLPVHSLSAWNGEVLAGGVFNWAESSANPSPGLARYLETGVPWLTQQPASQAAQLTGALSLTMAFVPGYPSVTSFRWRKNGVPLSDGGTVYGSGSQNLAIFPVALADSGLYDCVFSNACGVESTTVATVTVTYAAGVGKRDLESGLGLSVWPNPGRGAADVGFTLHADAPAEALVFDEQGKLVRTLARGVLPAGPHDLRWDGFNDRGARAGPGVYFVRVVTPGRSARQKFVLTR